METRTHTGKMTFPSDQRTATGWKHPVPFQACQVNRQRCIGLAVLRLSVAHRPPAAGMATAALLLENQSATLQYQEHCRYL